MEYINALNTMLPLIVLFCAIKLSAEQSVAKKCSDSSCAELAIRNGSVLFVTSGKFTNEREIGTYLLKDQHLVPKTELPIRDIQSREGWRVIVTVSIKAYDFIGPMHKFWIFDLHGNPRGSLEGDYFVNQIQLGSLFDDHTQILTIETQGPHAYTMRTRVFVLPAHGQLRPILNENAELNKLQPSSQSQQPGVWLNLETYDGVHSETKGRRGAFFRWNQNQEALIPPK